MGKVNLVQIITVRCRLPMKSAAVPSFVALSVVAGLASVEPALSQEPVRYLVRVDDPSSNLYHVRSEFPATGDVTLLSLPVWTPGHYKIENYARYVRNFEARAGGRALDWDKLDKDTWRVFSAGESRVEVSFDFLADSVGLSLSLLRDDFGFFNGTNLFFYPETGYEFASEVRFDLPPGWRVATELAETGTTGVWRAADYHELVDNPTFLGAFAIDSVRMGAMWVRLAVYPARYMTDPARELALTALGKIAGRLHDLFGPPPHDRYTTFVYLDDEGYPFVAGLEHSDSHLDIMPALLFDQPRFSFRPYVYRLMAHEYYHAWNVKRIRPEALWPYDYDGEQPTPLLWVSEGITDYYALVLLARAGLWSENEFWVAVRDAIVSVAAEPAHEAVEDASLNTWMEPVHIDQYLYYDKGALLGLLLDIRIRDATDNESDLDDVMSRLYRDHYQRGRGFSTEDFLGYVAERLGSTETDRFYRDYVDGREPLPLRETLALAGMRYEADTIMEPMLGLRSGRDGEGRIVVREVVGGSAAAGADLEAGDVLERVGGLQVEDVDWGDAFREAYFDSIGRTITVVYRRGGERRRTDVTIGSQVRYAHRLGPAPEATPRQREIRAGILSPDGAVNP